MIDMKDMSGKILWTKGREAGIEAERNRAIRIATDLSKEQEQANGKLRQVIYLDDFVSYLKDDVN